MHFTLACMISSLGHLICPNFTKKCSGSLRPPAKVWIQQNGFIVRRDWGSLTGARLGAVSARGYAVNDRDIALWPILFSVSICYKDIWFLVCAEVTFFFFFLYKILNNKYRNIFQMFDLFQEAMKENVVEVKKV